MATQLNMTLDQETLTTLQNLIRMNLDSRDGLREAAHNMSDQAVVELFQDIARDREAQAAELSRIVSANAQSPRNTGSTIAAVHRIWMDMRALLGGGTKAMLAEAKRGEDYLRSAYEAAIQACSNYSVGEILQGHFAAVKATYEAVRFMSEERGE